MHHTIILESGYVYICNSVNSWPRLYDRCRHCAYAPQILFFFLDFHFILNDLEQMFKKPFRAVQLNGPNVFFLYSVSQKKTSPTFLAITRESIVGFS